MSSSRHLGKASSKSPTLRHRRRVTPKTLTDGYVYNNPLSYTDPSGEIIGTAITAVFNTVKNVITHGINVEHYNWKPLENAWQIDRGLFTGSFGQILNKWTWGFYNTFFGNITGHVLNMSGQVDEVTHLEGAVALSGVTSSNSAFTIGQYIFGPDNFRADWKDHLFVHEYGHYVQSQWFGPLYLPIVASTSVVSAWLDQDHENRWYEVQASRMGARYFDKRYGSRADGYIAGSPDYFDINIFDTGGNAPYINPRTGNFLQGDHPTSGAKFHWFDILVPLSAPAVLLML